MRKRAVLFSLVVVASLAGFVAIKSRTLLPGKSSLTTFARDVRTAKRIFGNDYAGYLAAINRFGDQAFPGTNITDAEQALRAQDASTLVKPFENTLGFTLPGAEPDLPKGFELRPKFWLHTDPLSSAGKVAFSYDCEFALDESSEKVRQAMIRAGGFLKEVAERPGFIDLVQKNPTTLSGNLNYATGNCFDLQMKFLSENLVGKSVRYVVQVLVEPEEVRYVSWLPITYRRAQGTIVKIENQGEELSYQYGYESKEVIRSLHREDLKVVYPTGRRLHYTRSLQDLDSLPFETEGIQLVPPISERVIDKMRRFSQLKSLSFKDPTKGGVALPNIDQLSNLAFFAVEGDLSPIAVDSLCRLPKLEDVNLDAPNLSRTRPP